MFAWGGGLAAPSVGIDVDQERHPPPPATPLDFPTYIPSNTTNASFPPSPNSTRLCRLLGAIKKPRDLSPAYLEELNLKVVPDVPLSSIVPGNGQKPHSPSRLETASSQDIPEVGSMAVESLMSNGTPFPPQERYDMLKNEILVDNEDAFREVSRMSPLPGRPRLRIAHSRKFWVGLERMSQYWDTSRDRYIYRSEGPKDNNEGPCGNQMQVDGQDDSLNSKKESTSDSMDIDHKSENSETSKEDRGSGEGEAKPETTMMYMGRRVSNGNQMSDEPREDTVRGFLEMVAWPFGCQAHIPTMPPRLAVQNLQFPVRVSFALSRSPQDRQIARKGILEGPLVLGQCRNETVFREEGKGAGESVPELVDLLREVGTMLLGAQERAREGSTETKPGDGKWWATTPRWGGLSDQGVTGEKATRVEDKPPEESNKRSRYDRALLSSRRPGAGGSKRMTTSDKWKLVQPGPSLWDRKMKYTQIGRDKDSPFDDIFMVSSINHHISILHLRVHPRYLEWLAGHDTRDSSPPSSSSSEPWHKLELRRSRWFDLLNAEDRLEALDGVWGLLGWLMRRDAE